MNVTLSSPLFRPRFLRGVLLTSLIFSGVSMTRASDLLLYSAPGGPNQYNGHGPVLIDGRLVSLVSVAFDVPEAVRIQAIKAWINGTDDAVFSLSLIDGDWESFVPRSVSVPLEQVIDAPAKWQGVGSLKWNLPPGSYRLFIQAGGIPFGFGYHGPIPDSLYDFYDAIDYSEGFGDYPFGFQVYGTPLSAVPEPSTFGAMGSLLLIGLIGWRRRRRMVA